MNIERTNYNNEDELMEAFVDDILNDYTEVLTYKGEQVIDTSYWTLDCFLNWYNFNKFLCETMTTQLAEYEDWFLDYYNSFQDFLEDRYDLEDTKRFFIEQIFYNEYLVDLKN